MEFKDFFSLEDYQTILKASKDINESKIDWRKYQAIEECFDNALYGFLKHLKEEGKLEPIINAETHESHFIHAWKKLYNNEPLDHIMEIQSLTDPFTKIISFSTYDVEKGKLSVEEAYNKINQKFTAGNFQRFDIETDENCFCCGKKILPVIENWKTGLLTFEPETRQFIKLKPCIENKIIELNIEFKTGNLLMADWFRIEEFTKQVEYNKDYKETSINYTAGRLASTQHALKTFGFITVHLGNSSPSIFQNGNDFIFGHEDEETKLSPDFKYKGYVCTDLWNVTIIEKEQLINLVANKVGQEKAEQLIEDYLKDNKGNYSQFKVEPGVYKLSFHPDYEKFNHQLTEEDKVSGIEPMFSLKKVQLINKPKIKM